MQLERGVLANLVASFEVRGSTSAISRSTGRRACSCCPTRTTSREPCASSRAGEAGRTCPYTSRGWRDARGIGLHDMVEAIAGGTPHRASGLLGAHIVEVVRGILQAADEGRVVEIESRIAAAGPASGRRSRTRTPRAAEVALDVAEQRRASRSAAAKARSNATPPVSRSGFTRRWTSIGMSASLSATITRSACTSTAENGATK